MSKIAFPKKLENLLQGSGLQAPIRLLADRVGEILADNKLPFFPDYTDHGVAHVQRVLESEVSLVPEEVWQQSTAESDPRLLSDVDAAVIIGATLLHDIAMHLHPDGFLELIAQDSHFKPLPWFSDSREEYSGDRPWWELWQEYVREARKFSDRTLANIIGQDSVRRGWKLDRLPEDAGRWERNHFLLIGEFIRRHHARLAHEIAIYGFPGVPSGMGEGEFPALGMGKDHTLSRFADLIGLTARSHGMSLRISTAYLKGHPQHAGQPRPMGALALYAMALLRVADYLQIDQQRAPAVLLRLRNPVSPISVQEWGKHRAVESIGAADDPRGIWITISSDIPLLLYLQLDELLNGLQAELDHSAAVLDELYGTRGDLGLDKLGLSIRRVHSNLRSLEFRAALPYVPERAGFTADPRLLPLLVEPLYGCHPTVGVRELIQNAIDSVRELHAWCALHEKDVEFLDLPKQEADVQVDFVQGNDGNWIVRVTDKGIGMRPETIQNYFLRAGASFRQSAEWNREFVDEQGRPRVARSGRFGVGAFAIFLLGTCFRMFTRHASASPEMGYSLEATIGSEFIEIRRQAQLPIGTTIEVDVNAEDSELDNYFSRATDWYCNCRPSVVRRLIKNSRPHFINPRFAISLDPLELPPEWSVIHPPDYDAVFWTFAPHPRITCNGLRIAAPNQGVERFRDADFAWPDDLELAMPRIAVVDPGAALPVNIHRFGLTNTRLSFLEELRRDVALSFLAHALVCGPISQVEAHSTTRRCTRHPLSLDFHRPVFLPVVLFRPELRWCSTLTHYVPADPWLCSLVKTDCAFVYGIIARSANDCHPAECGTMPELDRDPLVVRWDLNVEFGDQEELPGQAEWMINVLVQQDIPCLGQRLGTRALLAMPCELISKELLAATKEHMLIRDEKALNAVVIESSRGKVGLRLALEKILRIVGVPLLGLKPCCVYVAEIAYETTLPAPTSLVAEVWHDYLGPTAIPFDETKRRELIEHGRRRIELRRHIEKWEEMKRTGSPYAVGSPFE